MTFLEVDKGVHESARKDGNVAERNRVARSPPESHDEKGNEYAPAPDTAAEPSPLCLLSTPVSNSEPEERRGWSSPADIGGLFAPR